LGSFLGGCQVVVIFEGNMSGNVNAHLTADILDVVGCFLGDAMWLLRYFRWLLGCCLLA